MRSPIFDMLRGIQLSIVDLGQRVDRVEQRMANLERRQRAFTHFEHSMLAWLTSIHESIDNFHGGFESEGG